jgi:hypothetical protein
VLALVFANRHLVRAIREDVRSLQHRIQEQPGRDELALTSRLLLELSHPVQLPVSSHRSEQPAELGVLMDIPLSKKDAPRRIETGGEQHRRRVEHRPSQLRRVVRDRDRVQVDDAVDRRIAAVLARNVLPDRSDVVAEVLAPRRLDAAEDPHGAKQRSRS